MIKFSKARQGGYHPKIRKWDIRLSHNERKIGEIYKDFRDSKCLTPFYTLDIMGQRIELDKDLINRKLSYKTLGEAKSVARAILKDKELLISILTRQSEDLINQRVNRAWSTT